MTTKCSVKVSVKECACMLACKYEMRSADIATTNDWQRSHYRWLHICVRGASMLPLQHRTVATEVTSQQEKPNADQHADIRRSEDNKQYNWKQDVLSHT